MKSFEAHRIFLITVGFLILSIACSIVPVNVKSGTILYDDNFSQENSNWKIWSKSGESAVSIMDGELIMILQQANTDIITTNKITHSDIQIEVDISKKHGSDDNLMGIVCRYQDDENYYAFLISSDGYYGLIKKIHGETRILNSNNLEFSEIIKQGTGMNHLSAICDGDSLRFTVNENHLLSIQDNELAFGGNGLISGSFDEPEDLVVTFDDFILRSP